MPTTFVQQFTNVGIRPYLDDMYSKTDAVKLLASVSYLKGTILGEQTGNNAVQKISIAGAPTGGTFTLTVLGVTTAAIAYNATPDMVRTAIEAAVSVGVVKCSGGQLPSFPVIVEFVGSKGNQPITTGTTTDSLTGGSTPASSVTSMITGSAGTPGTYKQVSKSLVAAPTAGPTLTPGGSDGSLTASAVYGVAYSYVNATGETILSPVVTATAASTNHIAVTAITPPSGCYVNWYMTDANASELRWFTANAGAGFNIILNPQIGTKKPMMTNTAYATVDGSQIARKILEFDCYTDASGNVTLGQASTGNEWAGTEFSAPAWYRGTFTVSDLVGWLDSMLPDLGATYIAGSLGTNTTTIGVIKF